VKAREFLAQKDQDVTLRNLIKEPLTVAELKTLAKRVGGPEMLVAPKQRAEAEGLTGDKLLAWLAEDGRRLRRPIIDVSGDVGGKVLLGFTNSVREELEDELGE
jgi:arsenate reductase-like glutaredoxin family protein